ncbi:flagellar assembly protein FliW [Paenibacillus sp. FSL W7-1287]|uniref:flagellar assembly protein FliW n=1 Tax=Paenibacillus sp. FSL W7-1287 TaxID=2954538 RepID=UPI0030F7FC4E
MSENNIASELIINSQLYGEIHPEPHQIYTFEQGIVGFSHLKQFALLPYDDTELYILQSFSEEISLLLLPAVMSANTEGFRIDDATVCQLGVQKADEIVSFYIVRFIDQQPYINLKAPILIVPDQQVGCQYVISDESVTLREPLLLAGDE